MTPTFSPDEVHGSTSSVDAQFDFSSTKPSQFHRVHKLTPIIQVWGLSAAGIFIFLSNSNAALLNLTQAIIDNDTSVLAWEIFAILAGIILLSSLIFCISLLWWRTIGFRLTHEEVQMRRGLLSLKLTSARYDRIQAVDLTESFLPRIFGLASVKVQTAGGKDSSISIEYLRKTKAEKIQHDIIELRNSKSNHVPLQTPPQTSLATSSTNAIQNSTPELFDTPISVSTRGATEVIIPEIPVRRSLSSTVWNFRTITLALGACLLILSYTLPDESLFQSLSGLSFPIFFGIILGFWKLLDRSYKFTATLTDGVLEVTYGLANRQKQSIPLERVHGIKITQPLLWRVFGWWQVHVSVAGYGGKVSSNRTATTLLPVGSRKQALLLLELLSPLNRQTIDKQTQPEGRSCAQFTSPTRARWVSPFDHKQQSVTLIFDIDGGLQSVVTHWGRFTRSMAVIDPSHIQELTLVNGPVQHLLKLTTIRFDLIQGPVLMNGRDLDPTQGEKLLALLRSRSLPALPAHH